MNIGKFDVMILITMGLAVVGISFVFPALGMSDTNVKENEIPKLNVSQDKLDFAGDMPQFPNTASEGIIWFNTTKSASFSENEIWLEGNTNGGYQLVLTEGNNNSRKVFLSEWNDSGEFVGDDSIVINDTNQRGVLGQGDYRVTIEDTEDNNPPDYLEIKWKVIDQTQTGGSFIGRLPGVGALFDVGSDIAAVIAWFITVFMWFSQTVVQAFLNVFIMIFDISTYFISLLNWLITTYTGVVGTAPTWTSVFVALPGIMLTVTLGKVLIIFVSLLPTT